MPIAMGVGYWCDGRFDSAPIGLLTGTVIGFAAMLLRIVRMRPTDIETETDTGSETGPPTGKEPEPEPEPNPGTENTAPERDRESDR
ncbi:MAG: AtpZ/AtpI family protein [Deltaproteobacteria bacterium]|nr:AtpZ/AtpI family protein [Deltaproteobacteria bacterium]